MVSIDSDRVTAQITQFDGPNTSIDLSSMVSVSMIPWVYTPIETVTYAGAFVSADGLLVFQSIDNSHYFAQV